LAGPHCIIFNEAGPLLTPKKTGQDLFFDATQESELAQVSAFNWVNRAHAFVADYLPAHPDKLTALPTHVNIDDTCNAFYDPTEHTLNFFRSAGGSNCPNTAYCDVAFHEYGHGVDDQFDGILDGGLSEGFGDAMAILFTKDSIVGRDFFKKGEHLRNAKDVIKWPPADPEVHEVGRIYAGFTWQLTQELKNQLHSNAKAFAVAKELILGANALNPKDIPDAVRLSFVIDYQNGSPHFDELAAAADSRNIPRPASREAVGDLQGFQGDTSAE